MMTVYQIAELAAKEDAAKKELTDLRAELAAERAKNAQLVTQSESRGKTLELCNAALELLRPIFERHNPHRDPGTIPGPCMCEVCRAFALAVTGEVAALAAEQEKARDLTERLAAMTQATSDTLSDYEREQQSLRESQAGAAALRGALQSLCDALNIHHFSKLERQKAVDDAFHASHIALATTAGASLIARLAELEALVAGLEHDRERLNYVEELIRNCPHAEITFNDDSDMDELLGFIIRVEGCETSESVGITFREAIDQDRASEIERRKA